MTAHKKLSVRCQACREKQQQADEKRKGRVRNYQAEAKRNMEASWTSFQQHTKKREITISLVKEEYLKLIQQKCFYCGYSNSDEIIGIDRVDNSKGYTRENCVPACKVCNRMKHIFHPSFFVGKANLITKQLDKRLIDAERDAFYTEWKEYVHKVPTPYIYVKRMNEEKRGLPFHLTKEQYTELIYKPCYLCGLRNRHGNGLDRIDNTKREYSMENVLPCCSTCNMMKALFTQDEFIKGVRRIAEQCKEIPDSWKTISRQGFQMGAARTETKVEPATNKQWRAKTIFKAVKAGTTKEFQTKVLGQTGWTDVEFGKKTAAVYEKIQKGSAFEEVEDDLKALVAKIRVVRLRK